MAFLGSRGCITAHRGLLAQSRSSSLEADQRGSRDKHTGTQWDSDSEFPGQPQAHSGPVTPVPAPVPVALSGDAGWADENAASQCARGAPASTPPLTRPLPAGPQDQARTAHATHATSVAHGPAPVMGTRHDCALYTVKATNQLPGADAPRPARMIMHPNVR